MGCSVRGMWLHLYIYQFYFGIPVGALCKSSQLQAKFLQLQAIASFSYASQQLEGSQALGSDWCRSKGSWRCQRRGMDGNKKTRHGGNKDSEWRGCWGWVERNRDSAKVRTRLVPVCVVRPQGGWTWQSVVVMPLFCQRKIMFLRAEQ